MRYGCLSLVFLVLGGCASQPFVGGASTLQVVDAAALPPPGRQDAVVDTAAYLIGPADKLTISVAGLENLTQKEILTDSSGRISFPLAGSIIAGGKTPQEVEGEIAARLRTAHVRDPQVTVNVIEAASQTVTVDGQVVQPGVYEIPGKVTLMRAIARARGTSEFAKLDDVVVFRTVEGRKMAALYNLSAIRRGVYADPDVYSNDLVVVGDSKSRRLFRDLLQAAPLLTTPLVIFLQNN